MGQDAVWDLSRDCFCIGRFQLMSVINFIDFKGQALFTFLVLTEYHDVNFTGYLKQFSDSHYIKWEHHSYFDSSAIPKQQASALPIMLTRRVCSLATRRPPTLPTWTAALQVHCDYFSRQSAASQAMMPNSPRLQSSWLLCYCHKIYKYYLRTWLRKPASPLYALHLWLTQLIKFVS